MQDWWNCFSQDVFPQLVPYRKWANPATSVDLGAVVLVQYSSRFAKDRYRLGRVLDLKKARDGMVRTVTVGLRNMSRAVAEAPEVNRAGLTRIDLPVQRLVIILPGRDQPKEVLEELEKEVRPVEQREHGAGRLKVRVPQEEEEIMDIV